MVRFELVTPEDQAIGWNGGGLGGEKLPVPHAQGALAGPGPPFVRCRLGVYRCRRCPEIVRELALAIGVASSGPAAGAQDQGSGQTTWEPSPRSHSRPLWRGVPRSFKDQPDTHDSVPQVSQQARLPAHEI